MTNQSMTSKFYGLLFHQPIRTFERNLFNQLTRNHVISELLQLKLKTEYVMQQVKNFCCLMFVSLHVYKHLKHSVPYHLLLDRTVNLKVWVQIITMMEGIEFGYIISTSTVHSWWDYHTLRFTLATHQHKLMLSK